MKTLLVSFSFSLFLLLPFFITAQDTGPTSTIFCPNLSQTLSFGMRDSQTNPRGQVTELQRFLSEYYDLNPDDYVTGFFGRLTRDNVRRFQCEKMNICTGTEATTGYGVVGPKTRASIASSCGMTAWPITPDPVYPPPQNQSCQTPWGTTIAHNASVTAYQSPSVAQGNQCLSEIRYCQNGTLIGSYQYQTCQVQTTTTTSCTPEQPQMQTRSCPTGQTGSITQTRTSSCPGPTWGAWVTTSNTCTTVGTVSCTLDGVTVAHTQSRAFYSARTSTNCASIAQTRTCTNGTLDGSGSYQYANCTTNTGSPSITITAPESGASVPRNAFKLSWFAQNYPSNGTTRVYLSGAGPVACEGRSSASLPSGTEYVCGPPEYPVPPGTYNACVSLYTGPEATRLADDCRQITVTGLTGMASSNSQLAAALAALESALQAFLKLLGQ